jgi:hypothetical protein
MSIALEIKYFNTLIHAIDGDGMFTDHPELLDAVEDSLSSGTFRVMVNDRISYLEDNATPREVGRTVSSSFSTIFKVCFLHSDSNSSDFRRFSACSIRMATMAIDDSPIYPDEDSGDESMDDGSVPCSFDCPSCSNTECVSFSPCRFLRLEPNEEKWLCLQCVESNPSEKLQFIFNNCSPGNGGLNWHVSEPPYCQKEMERFNLNDNEMWFTIYDGKPICQFHCFNWPELRFIMTKPVPRFTQP